ncbi:MAG: DUF4910 domain-containing protein [Sandaracinaceae bacterium]
MRHSLALAWLFVLACSAPPRATTAPTDRLATRAAEVHAAFRPDAALETVRYVDRFFRVRGNEGYQKTLERVQTELLRGGFDGEDVRRLELGPERPTWTPRAARLTLNGAPLIAFEDETGVDRATLLVGSDALHGELEVVRAEDVREGLDARGKVILGEGSPRALFEELVAPSGAVGLLVRSLEPYHAPDRYPESAQFGYLPEHEAPAFGFSLSDADHRALRVATETEAARVRVDIDVARGSSRATALEARIPGRDPDAGAIVFVAHADEPGANDNASGVATLAELALALRGRSMRRTLVFLWGQEMEVSRAWLEAPPVPVAAGLVLDMVGIDPEETGAPFLIERMPDPGAIWLRPPDVHTEWGATELREEDLRGHFLDDLLAASARAVAALDGPWRWRTNPFEGGSDHVPFLDRGLPAALGWHFTDDAYHTTRDRFDRVSGREMRRVAAVFGAAAITMASDDRETLRAALDAGERQRMRELRETASSWVREGRSTQAEEARVLDAWRSWYEQARRSVDAW